MMVDTHAAVLARAVELKEENEEVGKALRQRVLDCIRKDKEIARLNTELCLLQAEIARKALEK